MSLFHLMLSNYFLGTAEHIFKGKSDELQLLEVGTSLKTHGDRDRKRRKKPKHLAGFERMTI